MYICSWNKTRGRNNYLISRISHLSKIKIILPNHDLINFKEALINLSTAYMKINLLDKALQILQAGQSRFPQEALFDYNYACYHSLKKKPDSRAFSSQASY